MGTVNGKSTGQLVCHSGEITYLAITETSPMNWLMSYCPGENMFMVQNLDKEYSLVR